MATRRVSISESVYRSLQAEGLVTGESPGAVLERCILNGVSQKAREVLTTIGETSAKTEKPKVSKPKLTDNPQALQSIRDLWRSGERNQAAIARAVCYPRATVNENIRRMLAAGELSATVEEGGGESTGG